MRFTFLNVKITVSFLFVSFVTLMIFTDRTGFILPAIFAITLHEFAHLAAMRVLSVAPKEIMLSPGNIHIVRPECVSLKKENIILLCGPVSNLIVFALLYVLYGFFDNVLLLQYSAVQLVVALFNLLPAKGLDGGALIFNFLQRFFTPLFADKIQKIISFLVGGGCVLFGVSAFLNGEFNLSLFILGFYIIIFTIIKN